MNRIAESWQCQQQQQQQKISFGNAVGIQHEIQPVGNAAPRSARRPPLPFLSNLVHKTFGNPALSPFGKPERNHLLSSHSVSVTR